jgi:hypothetical protein
MMMDKATNGPALTTARSIIFRELRAYFILV